jgi:U3 small nucleolar RNA-associated protein 21
MATGSTLGHVALWNLEERCLSSTLRHAHDGSVTAIRFLQSQPLLISTSPDNSLKVRKTRYFPCSRNVGYVSHG